ncbi:MAG: SDR family oxidoreductase [Acidimicrobiia bacterium]|nr:SDR family oxidoreductase [Acidimicrobiia bacterium]
MKVLITGSARGIGASVAASLGAQGHHVAVHYRRSSTDAERVAQWIQAAGGAACIVAGDVTDPVQARTLVDAAVSEMVGLDVLINNVGGFLLKDLADVTPEEWTQQLASTVSATFFVTLAALPALRDSGRGRIVNFSDSSADKIMARPRSTPYSIGKTGVLILTRSLAVSEAPHQITVNAILPGVMDNSNPLPDPFQIPAMRHGTSDDVLAAVNYLISEEAAYVTGAFIHVGGGWNL